MRAKVSCLFLAILGAVALASGSGAVTQKANHVARIDVSTRASVVQYLRSIHVNPAGVVIQRGSRNYAGASCPGTGWTCTTTAHPVVQVASAGGRNRFVCPTAHCAVVQVSVSALAARASQVTNTAKCVKGSGTTQSCTINQTSSAGNNLAIVFENIKKGLGLSHTAFSEATITQLATGAANGNSACVTQNIKLSGSTGPAQGPPVTVTLEAHQSVSVTQDATGSGANSARYGAKRDGTCYFAHRLAQNQTLMSTANSTDDVTQNENVADSGANLTIDIEQNQGAGYNVASGPNNAAFVQTQRLTAIANSNNGPVSQTQSSVNGGVLGTVNQDSSGVSTATTKQTEIQCEDAATGGLNQCDTKDPDSGETPSSLTQTQLGPVRKGVGKATQTRNNADIFTVNQSSTQNTDQGDGSHQTNLVQGDCHTSGTSPKACSVTQTVTENGQSTTNTQSGQAVDITTTANCAGFGCTFNPPPPPPPSSGGGGSPPERTL